MIVVVEFICSLIHKKAVRLRRYVGVHTIQMLYTKSLQRWRVLPQIPEKKEHASLLEHRFVTLIHRINVDLVLVI